MPTSRPIRTETLQRNHASTRTGLLGLAAVMAAGMLLSGCNTTAGAGQDVRATGQAITRGANDVKSGL